MKQSKVKIETVSREIAASNALDLSHPLLHCAPAMPGSHLGHNHVIHMSQPQGWGVIQSRKIACRNGKLVARPSRHHDREFLLIWDVPLSPSSSMNFTKQAVSPTRLSRLGGLPGVPTRRPASGHLALLGARGAHLSGRAGRP